MKEFEKWFKKAEQDFFIIRNVIDIKDAPYELCCFHAQQAAEKYLKAYLTAHNEQFPKTHMLFVLVKQCVNRNNVFKEILENAKKLEEYAVSPRYPDDLDDISLEDAKQAYQNALTIKDFVITHFFE